MYRVKGFTLIELMVALVVLAIVLMLGVPAFTGSLERSRADADTGELLRALNFARMEALNNNMNVSLSATEAGDWTGDLEVLRDGNAIRNYAAMGPGASIATTGNVSSITFNSLGGLESSSTAIVFTYTRGAETKSIVVCPSGRVMAGTSCT